MGFTSVDAQVAFFGDGQCVAKTAAHTLHLYRSNKKKKSNMVKVKVRGRG